MASKSGLRNSFHSVATISASAPLSAAIGFGGERHRGVGAQHALRFGHRHRIVGGDRRAARREGGDDLARRRFAHVVGVRLERESPQRKPAAREVGAEPRDDLVDQTMLLRVVGRLDGRQHAHRPLELGRGVQQRLDVLREAAPAVADARIQEVVADPGIGPDALADQLDVGAEVIGEIGELVHERDPRRQHRVRRVFGELGRAHVHHQQPLVAAHERRVDRTHRGDRALVVGADHDAVGPHEIVDRRALLQEFRIGDHGEGDRRAAHAKVLRDRRADTVGGAYRHGGLVDDDLELGHPAADAARGREHVLHVGRAVLIGRRADGDELQRAVRDACIDVGGEAKAPGRRVAADERLQPGFVDRHAARFQHRDLAGVDVDAQHVVADFGQARSRKPGRHTPFRSR